MTLPSNLIPITVSSGFDPEGNERIHAANEQVDARPSWSPPPLAQYMAYSKQTSFGNNCTVGYSKITAAGGFEILAEAAIVGSASGQSKVFDVVTYKNMLIAPRMGLGIDVYAYDGTTVLSKIGSTFTIPLYTGYTSTSIQNYSNLVVDDSADIVYILTTNYISLGSGQYKTAVILNAMSFDEDGTFTLLAQTEVINRTSISSGGNYKWLNIINGHIIVSAALYNGSSYVPIAYSYDFDGSSFSLNNSVSTVYYPGGDLSGNSLSKVSGDYLWTWATNRIYVHKVNADGTLSVQVDSGLSANIGFNAAFIQPYVLTNGNQELLNKSLGSYYTVDSSWHSAASSLHVDIEALLPDGKFLPATTSNQYMIIYSPETGLLNILGRNQDAINSSYLCPSIYFDPDTHEVSLFSVGNNVLPKDPPGDFTRDYVAFWHPSEKLVP